MSDTERLGVGFGDTIKVTTVVQLTRIAVHLLFNRAVWWIYIIFIT